MSVPVKHVAISTVICVLAIFSVYFVVGAINERSADNERSAKIQPTQSGDEAGSALRMLVSATEYAQKNPERVRVLLEHPEITEEKKKELHQHLITAIYWGQYGVIEEITTRCPELVNRHEISKGEKSDYVFDDTPLTTATWNYGRPDILELLLKKGAKVNDSYINNFTPLHAAVSRGNREGVKLLLRYGARVNVVSEDFKTPLDVAFYPMCNSDDGPEACIDRKIVDMLVRRGAKRAEALQF